MNPTDLTPCTPDCSGELCHPLMKQLMLFSGLEEQELAEVASFFRCRQEAAGSQLWKEGAIPQGVVFVVEGKLEITKSTEFSDHQVVVGIYGPGAIAGELSLFSGYPHAVSATALTDVQLISLSRQAYDQLVEEHPHLGLKLMRILLLAVSTRLRRSYDRLASLF